MKPLPQPDYYAEPDDGSVFDHIPLVVHRPTALAARRKLIVFVHGLTGRRYGYWGNTPKFLAEDVPDADIGLYFYKTAWRRRGLFRSIEVEEEARVLADELQSLVQYDRIVLVTHSLGGVLARAAIALLRQDDKPKVLKRLSGLILLGVPMAGSRRVPALALLFSRDARALYPHNKLLTHTSEVLSQISIEYAEGIRRANRVPMWAIKGSEDFWVDQFSSSLGIPPSQRPTIRATHSELTKPASKDSEVYVYCRDWIRLALGLKRVVEQDSLNATVSDARYDDAETIKELADAMLGGGVSDIETIHELMSVPGIIRVVRESQETANVHTDTVKGYLCVIPLTAIAQEAVKTGQLAGNQIRLTHVEQDWSKCAAIYIGAIVGEGFWPRALVVQALQSQLSEIRAATQRNDIELLTRPITKDGERLARDNRFNPNIALANGVRIWSRTLGSAGMKPGAAVGA
jgi:pimeloyl-ACP methyl ester carboxylesterase